MIDASCAASGGTGGNLWVWGANERGQLGLADTTADALAKVEQPVLAHTRWEGWHGLHVTKMAAAHYSSSGGTGEFGVALTSDGRVLTFGDCTAGNLGTGLPTMALLVSEIICGIAAASGDDAMRWLVTRSALSRARPLVRTRVFFLCPQDAPCVAMKCVAARGAA
jgi:hypothetical protein